jgi:hypothetical protein
MLLKLRFRFDFKNRRCGVFRFSLNPRLKHGSEGQCRFPKNFIRQLANIVRRVTIDLVFSSFGRIRPWQLSA